MGANRLKTEGEPGRVALKTTQREKYGAGPHRASQSGGPGGPRSAGGKAKDAPDLAGRPRHAGGPPHLPLYPGARGAKTVWPRPPAACAQLDVRLTAIWT